MKVIKLFTPLIIICLLMFIPSLFPSPFLLHLLITIFLYGIVCESWDLSMGYLGLFNFGHLAFFAIGAYSSGMLALYYDISPWIAMIVSSIITFILGLLISLVTLRASEFAFSLISFAFQSMFMYWVRSGGGPAPGEFGIGGTTLTGGTQGLGAKFAIPPFNLGSIIIRAGANKIPAYYLTAIIFVVVTCAMYLLVNSRFGLATVALRDSKTYAISRGINPLTYTAIFISISTFFAGMAGSLYVHLMGVVGPEIIGWSNVVIMCCIVEFGGLGTIFGPAAASFLLISLTYYLAGLSAYKNIIIALIMLFTLLIWPTGMAGAASWFKSRYLNRKRGEKRRGGV
jgi:branched-chain amino acid transport system permease protein